MDREQAVQEESGELLINSVTSMDFTIQLYRGENYFRTLIPQLKFEAKRSVSGIEAVDESAIEDMISEVNIKIMDAIINKL